ncbi:hypothetical protein CRUP_007402, partial [Coryphaenoides rupestris]
GVVLLSLAFLMPAFYYIPKASLAAVIICAVAPMVDYRLVAEMWRVRNDLPWCVARGARQRTQLPSHRASEPRPPQPGSAG